MGAGARNGPAVAGRNAIARGLGFRSVSPPAPARPTSARPSPWRLAWGLGVVSLSADMVYEGARSVYGPALAALGARAAVVGLVTGAGEAAALVLRLAFGPLADRTARYWQLTIAGYALTCMAVPLLAVAPRLGAAGLAAAIVLILLERTGKAIRSPAKSALLADAAGSLARGRGFGVHKALDQTGAFAGPLLVAAVIAGAGTLWPGFAVLAVPGALALILLAYLRRAAPDLGAPARPAITPATAAAPGSSTTPALPPAAAATPSDPPPRPGRGWIAAATGVGLPRAFFTYAVATSLTTGGLVTFGVLGYHLTTRHVIATSALPIAYAGAMAIEALAALAVSAAYDRHGARVLLLVPPARGAGPTARPRRPARAGPGWAGCLGHRRRDPGFDDQGPGRRPRRPQAAGHGIRGLRRNPGRIRHRRRPRRWLALRALAHRTGHCGRADPSPRARCARDLAGRPSRLRISAPGDQSPRRDHALARGGVAAG